MHVVSVAKHSSTVRAYPGLINLRSAGRLLLLGLLLVILVGLQPARHLGAALSDMQDPRAAAGPQAPASLPVAFIPHASQGSSGAEFRAQALQGAVTFSAGQIDLALPAGALRLRFMGANDNPFLTAGELLPGTANFYTGADPSDWRTDVPTYAALTYQGLYPGIDLVYTGMDGQLKSAYLVAPGADPAQIRWRYDGAQRVELDASRGELLVGFGAAGETGELPGRLTESAPVAWQVIDGARVPVAAAYTVQADGQVGFTLGAYDPAHPLTIDPYLAYSSFLGGTLPDEAYTVSVDGQGNAFIAGATQSTDFLGQAGTTGTEDVWIVKLNAAGSAALYTTFLTGSGSDRPIDMVFAGNGGIILTGYTDSANFPTLDAAQPDLAGGIDFFVTRLDNTGQLVYSTFLGTEFSEQPQAIARDNSGRALIVGQINGRAAIYKLSPSGAMLYGALFGGSTYGETTATGVAVNAAGEVILAGYSTQKDLGATAGAFQSECDGIVNEFRGCRGDVFLAVLNNANRLADLQILYNSYYGGLGEDRPEALYLAPDGHIYITGQTISINFPTTAGAYAPDCPSGPDASNSDQCLNYETFVTRFSPDFSDVVYSTYFGASYKDYALAIGADSSGAAYVGGWVDGDTLPLVNPIQGHAGGICYSWVNIPRPCIDLFVARFSPAGALEFSTFLGGVSDDFLMDMAVEPDGDVYVVGSTLSTNFPTTPGSVQANYPNPGRHGYVSKISPGASANTCYQLTRSASGSGDSPLASPANSPGCNAGFYTAGTVIQLTANPADGWRVSGWSGTNNNSSTSTVNQVTMPSANHTVSVSYVQVVLPENPFRLNVPLVFRP